MAAPRRRSGLSRLARLARLLPLAGLAALSLLLFDCALPEAKLPPSPAHAVPYYAKVDWARADAEIVTVLSEYLKVDTTNPPGNETRGAEHLGKLLAAEGIPYEILEYAPGRGNLIARLEGSGKEPPLCLVSHLDVVTAEAATWKPGRGPLSGAVADGYIWGRGALDMKSLGAVELMSLVWLKRIKAPLRRSVVLVAVAAEETDSGGIRFLVDKHWDKLGCSQSVNEGGIGIKDLLLEGQTVYPISVAEKGTLWVKMTAHGEAGHGSTPVPGRAPERLLAALDKLSKRDPAPVIDPAIYELAARAGYDTGGVTGQVLRRPFLVRQLVLGKLLANPPARATLFNTVNVTGFEGRNEPNVIPSQVSAILDCRLLPGTSPSGFLGELKTIVADPQVTFEVLDSAASRGNTWQDPFFEALARHAIGGRAHVVAGPALSPGYTDSLYLRDKGVHAFGFMPFEVEKEELLGYHGKNERLSVVNLQRGLRALFRAIVDVSVE